MIAMPSLSLSSPLGFVMSSAVRANWRLRCSFKFDSKRQPPHWKHFLYMCMHLKTGAMVGTPNPYIPAHKKYHAAAWLETVGKPGRPFRSTASNPTRLSTPAHLIVPPMQKDQETGP